MFPVLLADASRTNTACEYEYMSSRLLIRAILPVMLATAFEAWSHKITGFVALLSTS
jgi:hypothetical protein